MSVGLFSHWPGHQSQSLWGVAVTVGGSAVFTSEELIALGIIQKIFLETAHISQLRDSRILYLYIQGWHVAGMI